MPRYYYLSEQRRRERRHDSSTGFAGIEGCYAVREVFIS
jgi:hypothetical protein